MHSCLDKTAKVGQFLIGLARSLMHQAETLDRRAQISSTQLIIMRISLLLSVAFILLPNWVNAQSVQPLPRELAEEIRDITAACKADEIPISALPDPGVSKIDLNGDGSRDFLFDTQQVCGGSPGHGCSNRGCRFVVYKQIGSTSYQKVLNELYGLERFISISKNGRLNLIAYSAPGGFGRCQQKNRDESCDFLLSWRSGNWKWTVIQ